MQGNFENEWHHLRANILSISSKIRLRLNEILEPHGITHQQFNALRILRGQLRKNTGTSFSTQDLRAALIDKSADSSRLIDRLVQKGLVSKTPCSEDTRRVNLVISENGLKLLDAVDIQQRELNNILKIVSEEDVIKINHFLDKIDDKFNI
jgi:DNA-binding MarR family transcriptional regulator